MNAIFLFSVEFAERGYVNIALQQPELTGKNVMSRGTENNSVNLTQGLLVEPVSEMKHIQRKESVLLLHW